MNDPQIGKKEFLKLSVEEIRQIVIEREKPEVGVFLADGNRRIAMIKTGLAPNTDEFYQEYSRIFLNNFRNALNIFFDHGLKTLFFPLLGPSLLLRKNKFQTITIPLVYKALFLSDDWHQYYKEKDIRIKAYGDLEQVKQIDPTGQNMVSGIDEATKKTAKHKSHTLFIGFVSNNTIDAKIAQHIIDFYKSTHRVPDYREMVEAYYGEFAEPVDFFISSTKIAGIHGFPPLLSSKRTRMYYFAAPFFMSFNACTLREILYDLLFLQSDESISEYDYNDIEYIDTLAEFYQNRKDKIIGIGKKIGRFWITEI